MAGNQDSLIVVKLLYNDSIEQTVKYYGKQNNRFSKSSGFKSVNEADDPSGYIVKCYGMQISQFNTSSGFGSGTEVSIYVKGRNKSLELGAYFDNGSKSLTGLSLCHKYFIMKNYFDKQGIIEPYLFYNFIYRSTTLDETLSKYPELIKCICPGKAVYKSLEHAIGFGLEINLLSYMYLNCNIGFERYLGSIKKPCNPDQYTGVYDGGDGWGAIYKIGFGFRIP